MALLEVKDLEVNYGLIKAIKGVSFEVNEGEVVALIGANGAGKTTIMHAVNGLIPKAAGTVSLAGEDITGIKAHKLVSRGMAQVPEGRRIFQELSVFENLQMGFFTRRDKSEFDAKLEEMYSYFPILKERSSQIAGTLSGGEQQMLAMSRALMSSPKLLLLDEPSMGLSPLYVNTIFDMIKKVNSLGTTVLLVEQNARKALSIADRAYVLEIGKMVKTGSGAELLSDPEIRKAYLGG
ncbi:MAG: ABC transporter ATP-binding protein [Clostridia bacterium]|nr:ABC transporter ATP-binding protein [Clostridia bacterium]MBP3583111.1 ABC transporter ATP-binding protein [Clostridia bacterium]MBQ8583734.1 ABC transporter ATP-binding protein [Clostridia bacterium]